MDEQTALGIIQNVGFPMAITLWFMLRTEKVINRNTEAFEKISAGCPALKKKITTS